MLYFSLLKAKSVPKSLLVFDDLFLHLGMYFANYTLFYLGIIGWNLRSFLKPLYRWGLFFLSIGIGGIIELIQEFYVDGRTGSMSDMASNTIGSLIGLLLITWWHRRSVKHSVA
jgi:VanZ family protein